MFVFQYYEEFYNSDNVVMICVLEILDFLVQCLLVLPL